MNRPAALAASIALAGCATAPVQRPLTSAELIQEARAEGLALVDPIGVDDEMTTAIRKAVPLFDPPRQRAKHVAQFIKNRLEMQYQASTSLTAFEAYRARKGDCMAFTNLFVALARKVNLDAFFVHVSDVRNYYEQGGWFFVSSHVAAGVGRGPDSIVIDFNVQQPDWKLAIYRGIDDVSATALYYSNVAVDALLAGKLEDAEKLMRFLVERDPNVPEVFSNLGVVLSREGRYAAALDVIERGIERFPTYEPLFTNGVRAARGAGRLEEEADLERRGQAISEGDPFFLFARGVGAFQDKRYEQSVRSLRHATTAKPDSPLLWAWLSRALFASGRAAEGRTALARAKAIAPADPMVKRVEREYGDALNEKD